MTHEPNNKPFLKNALVYGLGGVIAPLGSFILLPIYTHYLNPGDYGIIELLNRIGEFIGIIFMTNGVRQACFAFYLQANTELDRNRVAATISSFLLVVYAVSVFLAFMMSGWLVNSLGTASKEVFSVGIAAALAQMFTIIPFALMQARVESLCFVSWQLSILFLRILLTATFVAPLDMGIWGIISANAIVNLGSGIILTIRELRHGSWRIEITRLKEILRFSLPFVPTGVIFFFIFSADRFFLASSAGPESLGIYALGCKLAGAIGMVSTGPLFKVWSAELYAVMGSPSGPSKMATMLQRMLLAHFAAATALSVFSPEILYFISDVAYRGSSRVIPVIALAGGFLFASNFMEGVFYVNRRTGYKAVTAAIAGVVTGGLYVALIPRFGIDGAMYASLIGYASLATITYVFSRRVQVVPYRFDQYGILILISALAFLASRISINGSALFLWKLLLLLLWLVLVWSLGLVDKDVKIWLSHYVKRFFRSTGW